MPYTPDNGASWAAVDILPDCTVHTVVADIADYRRIADTAVVDIVTVVAVVAVDSYFDCTDYTDRMVAVVAGIAAVDIAAADIVSIVIADCIVAADRKGLDIVGKLDKLVAEAAEQVVPGLLAP